MATEGVRGPTLAAVPADYVLPERSYHLRSQGRRHISPLPLPRKAAETPDADTPQPAVYQSLSTTGFAYRSASRRETVSFCSFFTAPLALHESDRSLGHHRHLATPCQGCCSLATSTSSFSLSDCSGSLSLLSVFAFLVKPFFRSIDRGTPSTVIPQFADENEEPQCTGTAMVADSKDTACSVQSISKGSNGRTQAFLFFRRRRGVHWTVLPEDRVSNLLVHDSPSPRFPSMIFLQSAL
ncbi:hypothetical protein MPH_09928 [Macrophomina phaseolina MS6]|uniref:Uncharacterized protein n=1 Tax=Macrophomina phaseolina (strain MS6) TaxID=1126212 RepID=K2QSY0_MACPH|nr:hypothetical protein MPH_09928 [Macrophomina phaseolina MS6]